ncbi:AMP-binding protein [Geobacter metallireducens]|uniref:AMP-binding protein n=1 Tax=Geobacter metallireducens TaxID=28232 RepID=UPI0003034F92
MDIMDYCNLNQAQLLHETVSKVDRDKTAIIFKDRILSWGELRELSSKLAKALLRAGIKKGDRVGIMMTNIPEWIVVRNAVAWIGAWLVPINTRYKTHELEMILSSGEVNALFIMDTAVGIDFIELLYTVCPGLSGFAPGKIALPELPYLQTVICLSPNNHGGMFRFSDFLESGQGISDKDLNAAMTAVTPHDVSTVLFTSGTTGVPKGVLTTHHQSNRVFAKMGKVFQLAENDAILGCTPFFTNFGLLTTIKLGELFGTRIVIFETFNTAEIIEGVQKHNITMFAGTPAMFTMLMNDGDFSPAKFMSMRVGDIGGAPYTPTLGQRNHGKIWHVPVCCLRNDRKYRVDNLFRSWRYAGTYCQLGRQKIQRRV